MLSLIFSIFNCASKLFPSYPCVHVEHGSSLSDVAPHVEADAMEKVNETITWKIRRLDRVRSTLTLIVVEA